jgi:hypothetical protein
MDLREVIWEGVDWMHLPKVKNSLSQTSNSVQQSPQEFGKSLSQKIPLMVHVHKSPPLSPLLKFKRILDLSPVNAGTHVKSQSKTKVDILITYHMGGNR